MNQLKLIKYAAIACVALLIVWKISSLVMGVPMFEFFHEEKKIEKTATVLRSVQQLNNWVFLTVEDQEVVYREHGIFSEDVAKIYSAAYELGIDLTGKEKWFEVLEVEDKKLANIVLPPIKILHENAIDDSETMDVYGDASDGEKIDMKKEAGSKMRKRALSVDNVKQAKASAETHFKNLFTILGCDSVKVTWEEEKKR